MRRKRREALEEVGGVSLRGLEGVSELSDEHLLRLNEVRDRIANDRYRMSIEESLRHVFGKLIVRVP